MPLGWVAAAGVVGSVISASASSDAASQQASASENAQQISQQQYQDTVNRNAPYTQSGYGALSALDYGLGISPQTSSGQIVSSSGSGSGTGIDTSSGYQIGSGGQISQGISGGTGTSSGSNTQQTGGLGYGSLTKSFDTSDWQQMSPAYNFQLRQGQQGVQNASAAGQGSLSGAALKDLTDYNQSAANTSYNNAFNQYQTQQGNIYDRLSGIAQLGQSSANNTGQQGTALAGQAAQSATNVGTAQAGGTVGSANAISSGLSNASTWLAGSSSSNNNASLWDTENTSNLQDFTSSDRRLKTDIRRVGTLDSGLAVYTFKYRDSPLMTHLGVMADEVQQVIPQAVTQDARGHLQVSYGMLR
jgi:hypothetical protein